MGNAHLGEVIEGAAGSQVAVEQVVQVADAPCLPACRDLGQPATPRLYTHRPVAVMPAATQLCFVTTDCIWRLTETE